MSIKIIKSKSFEMTNFMDSLLVIAQDNSKVLYVHGDHFDRIESKCIFKVQRN